MKKYYKKGSPHNLITEEILKNVPPLYGQEGVKNSEKVVHSAYIIPFKYWTLYMTEYDPKTEIAYGLVIGDNVEWGYFSLKDLRSLNAQRLILEDFPKTFMELKDTELKKHVNKNELYYVFNGEIQF